MVGPVFRYQFPNVPSFTWISRATSAIGREVSTTIFAASSLNSGVYFLRRSGIYPIRSGPDLIGSGVRNLGGAPQWGAIFILVSVGLFWAVNSYAIGVGTSRGQQIERDLGSSADVVLYSEKSLDLQALGVREMICSTPENIPEAAYRFRYEGLKFVLQSGNHYLFLPKGWTRDSGVALVIPRSDALRLEFSGPGQGVRDDC